MSLLPPSHESMPWLSDDELEVALWKTLREASDLATAEALRHPRSSFREDHEWLAQTLRDLYCAFSEEGTTYEQDARLKAMGLPCKQ